MTVHYAAASGARGGSLVLLLVAALAADQTTGKLVLFEGARRGLHWFKKQTVPDNVQDRPRSRPARISAWMLREMRERGAGVPVVITSATLGLPPLAVVSVVAGLSGQRRTVFGVICFAGRFVRFTVIALPLAGILG